VGAAIDPAGHRLETLLQGAPLEPGESIDVVDSAGRVLASTDRRRLFLESDHAQFLAGLIRERRAVSGSCHGCHEQGRRVSEVFAFAPLPLVPWGVAVRQPQSSAYAFAGALSRNLLLWTAGGLALALVFAYGAARSVTRPLGALTRSAERLSKGELAAPIPALPPDEVGRLGEVLEQMRVALSDSLAGLAAAKAELEARVRERTGELEGANRALREREGEIRLALSKVIGAQEDERRRVARELHDETCQSLSALVMALETAAKQTEDPDARRRLKDSGALAVRALGEVHRVIVDLRPSVLDDLGLRSAIEWYAERALRRTGVNARCEFSGLERRLPPELETALFRCAQEAMTNIARHARAENVLVQCAVAQERVRLEIEDDGEGFEPSALRTPDRSGRGLGLMGMRERVELLGGRLQLVAAPGQGTHLTLELPLPDEEGPR
jgi:signal transduction histidine kinase